MSKKDNAVQLAEIKAKLDGITSELSNMRDDFKNFVAKAYDFQNKLVVAFIAMFASLIGEHFLGSPPLEQLTLTLLLFGFFFAIGRSIYLQYAEWKLVVIALVGLTSITFSRVLVAYGFLAEQEVIAYSVRIIATICLVVFGWRMKRVMRNDSRR